MSSLFQKLELEAFRAGITPRTAESREWFRKKVANMRNINRNTLMRDESLQLKNRQLIGSMNMFFYDPKHKDTLPYYDTFPLSIIVGPAPGGFYGMNLHYLSPINRAKFLDALMDITNNNRYDETTRFRASYDLLKRAGKYRLFKPCYKHYLSEHVRSRFARVEAPEWEIATFLPTANFQKSTRANVYRESARIARQR